jgi:L-lactate dehydrogenase complex protein LldG
MHEQPRDSILDRLKSAAYSVPKAPQPLSPLAHSLMDTGALKEAFVQNLAALGAEVHCLGTKDQVLETLKTVIDETGMNRLFVCCDPALDALGLEPWARNNAVDLIRASDFDTRDDYTGAVFQDCTLGFTTVDAAVAESGTLVIAHRKEQPRLVSLAPLVHIALVRMDQLVPVYEDLPGKGILGETLPSQTTLISGPSMTADIQATPFKGMHGPKRLIVLLLDQDQPC